ncbi:unnamed protein product, partial [marine sediment metagenome]
MDISKTIPGNIGKGIWRVKRRNKTTAAIVKGTSKVRIAKIPVIILASIIRFLLTAKVDKSAEIFLVLSKYIWVAPIAQMPNMTIVTAGTPSPIENTGGTFG